MDEKRVSFNRGGGGVRRDKGNASTVGEGKGDVATCSSTPLTVVEGERGAKKTERKHADRGRSGE